MLLMRSMRSPLPSGKSTASSPAARLGSTKNSDFITLDQFINGIVRKADGTLVSTGTGYAKDAILEAREGLLRKNFIGIEPGSGRPPLKSPEMKVPRRGSVQLPIVLLPAVTLCFLQPRSFFVSGAGFCFSAQSRSHLIAAARVAKRYRNRKSSTRSRRPASITKCKKGCSLGIQL